MYLSTVDMGIAPKLKDQTFNYFIILQTFKKFLHIYKRPNKNSQKGHPRYRMTNNLSMDILLLSALDGTTIVQ